MNRPAAGRGDHRRLRARPLTRRDERSDRGAILVQSIVFVGVVSAILVALANYTMVGIRGTATSRSMLAASSSARGGLQFAMERYSTDAWPVCTSLTPLVVPAELRLDASSLSLTCAPHSVQDGHPVVVVVSQAGAGQAVVTLRAFLQVSVDGPGVALLSVERL